MSDKQVVSDKDITNFIRFGIELTPTLEVDPDGYVMIKEDNKKALIEVNGDEKDTKVFKPIIVYQGCIKDQNAIILNPFIEGMARNVSGEWFLDILTANATQFVRMIQKTLIIHALESKRLSELAKTAPKKKSSKKDKETEVVEDTPIQDIKLAGIIARWVDKVDDTTLTELDLITKKMSNYINITYFRKSHEARITTGFDSEDFRTAHKKVRHKSWEVFKDMLQFIFSTTDFSEYVAKANSTHCPRLDATLRLLLKMYSAMNPYMKYLPDELKEVMIHKEVDLDYLSSSIDLLDVFKIKTAHITSVAPANPNSVLKTNPVADALHHNRNGFFNSNTGGFFATNTTGFFNKNGVNQPVMQSNTFGFNGSLQPLSKPDPSSITKPSVFGVSTTVSTFNSAPVSMFNGGNGW